MAELLDDLAASQGRLHAAWAAMPDDAWGRSARTPPGRGPRQQGVRTRRREILVHLVDLDLGFGPADLPADYLEFDAGFVAEHRTRATWPGRPAHREARASVLNQVVDNGGTMGVGCIQPFS